MARTRRVAAAPTETPKAPASAPSPLALAVTVRGAALRYAKTEKGIRAMIAAGILPAARPSGTKSYVILLADLDRVFAPRVRTPATRPETDEQAAERQLRCAGIA